MRRCDSLHSSRVAHHSLRITQKYYPLVRFKAQSDDFIDEELMRLPLATGSDSSIYRVDKRVVKTLQVQTDGHNDAVQDDASTMDDRDCV